MDTHTNQELFDLATEFRAAILAYNQTEEGRMSTNWQFGRFPVTSCLQSSTALAYWLNQQGKGAFVVVSGQRQGCTVADPRDHAWVESADGEIVIDITLDQFGEQYPSVLVKQGMTDSHADHRINYNREVIDTPSELRVYEMVYACVV